MTALTEYLDAVRDLGAQSEYLRISEPCTPRCGVRYRGRLMAESFAARVVVYGALAAQEFGPLVGEPMHIAIGGGYGVCGVPESIAAGSVTVRVLYEPQQCGVEGCGHVEGEHYGVLVTSSPWRVEPRCRSCDDGLLLEIAGHAFEGGSE